MRPYYSTKWPVKLLHQSPLLPVATVKKRWVATAPKLKARIPQTGAAMGGGVKERSPPPPLTQIFA